MAGNHLISGSEYVVISGAKGVYLHSKEGGYHLNQPGDESYFIVDTKNLACIRTQKGINIVDDGSEGMVDIQADDLINLAVMNSANTQFTGLNIVDGKTHIGVFGVGTFDRLHAKSGEIKLESSAGVPNAAANLGLVEVTPSKVTIKCMESIMEVDVNGFELKPAAKTFGMKLTATEFSVSDKLGQSFKIDLTSGRVTIGGMQVAIEAKIAADISTAENKIKTDIAKIQQDAIAVLEDKVEAIKKAQNTVNDTNTQAITDIKSILTKNSIK